MFFFILEIDNSLRIVSKTTIRRQLNFQSKDPDFQHGNKTISARRKCLLKQILESEEMLF